MLDLFIAGELINFFNDCQEKYDPILNQIHKMCLC